MKLSDLSDIKNFVLRWMNCRPVRMAEPEGHLGYRYNRLNARAASTIRTFEEENSNGKLEFDY